MSSFASESLRMLKRLVRGPGAPPAHAGKPQALDGLSAVAAVEARICDGFALGSSYPASLSARVAEHASSSLNALAQVTGTIDADGPRSALSAAIGMTLAGRRTSVFLTGQDLLEARDLVSQAAHRHAPVVVQVTLRAAAQQGQSLGTGHEVLGTLLDLPAMVFIARNVQEAVDLTLLARRCAELALLPAVVAMDCEQTALSVQSVALPDDELLRSYIGATSEVLPPPTQAQRLLFGDTRRRLPSQFDLERPAMLGSLQDPQSFALGAASRRAFFEPELPRLVAESATVLSAQTGRTVEPLDQHQLKGAETVLVAVGSMVEHAIAAAEVARAGGHKVGVVGLGRLAPLDGAALAAAIGGAEVVCVLERSDLSPDRDGPVMRLVRGAIDRARENAQHGAEANHGYPTLKRSPRLVGVAAGVGGLPVRAGDFAALLKEIAFPKRGTYYLGLAFNQRGSAYPKHQVLLDGLRRAFPTLDTLGVAGDAAAVAVDGLTAIEVVRAAGSVGETLGGQLAGLLHGIVGGGMRSRPALTWQRGGKACEDRVVFGPAGMVDPGDDIAIDVAIIDDIDEATAHGLRGRLSESADVLVRSALAQDPSASAALGMLLATGQRRVHVVSCASSTDAKARQETMLGAAAKVALARLGVKTPNTGQMRSRREEALAGLSASECSQRADAFVAGFEGVTPGKAPASPAARPAATHAPAELAELSTSEVGPASLTRFWNHTGAFVQSGESGERVPEPGAALGVVPALSALFRKSTANLPVMPAFDPATCDGSPKTWMSCPDGSVAPLAITGKQLLEAGIELATRAGAQADALRPLISQIARRMHKLATGKGAPTTAGELILTAFDEVNAKSDAPEDRRKAQQAAMDAVVAQVGELPLAVTDVFFREPEKASAGTGAFLSLAVNPDAGKSAELVLARGEGHGLVAVERSPGQVERARSLWRLWQKLPDTSGDIIERARKDARIGTLAAMMLSRHCLHAMTPGDGAEASSGAKLALRQVLAVGEYHAQPRMQRLLGQIAEAQGKLSDRIQSLLAKALPSSDLEALARGLETLGKSDVELAELSAKIDSAVVDGHVDGEALALLVETARGLADLHYRIRRGAMGLGRARAALTIAAGSVAQWAAAFPDNPFAMPTLVDACGEAGGLARGALDGYLREVVDGFRLLRLAKVELDRAAEAPHAAARLASLTFADLTSDERELIPPMIVIGDAETLGGRGLSQVMWLMDSGLPVKVVVLSGIGGKGDGALSIEALGSYPPARRYDVALLGALSRTGFVAQTSLALPDHFADSVERALATSGPALVHVHTPSPERHGFAPTRLFEQAELAVQSRAWPVFTFDPTGPGVFGSCIDISGNPSRGELWARDEHSRPLTPADFALSEARFAAGLAPLDKADASPTPIADYLSLEPAQRAGRTPVVERLIDGRSEAFRVSAALIADADDRVRLWRTLQELCGQVTPFTQQVRAEAEQAVAAEHAAEIARLKSEYEAKLAGARAQYAAEVTSTVTSRLMELAGYNGGGRN